MYAYSLNDPVNRFDPGGEIALTISVIYVVGVCVGVLGIGSLVITNGSILDNSTEKIKHLLQHSKGNCFLQH